MVGNAVLSIPKHIVYLSKRNAGDGVPYRKNKYNKVMQKPAENNMFIQV
jgi:hypothetical protein